MDQISACRKKLVQIFWTYVAKLVDALQQPFSKINWHPATTAYGTLAHGYKSTAASKDFGLLIPVR
jgi:hypothetical protein